MAPKISLKLSNRVPRKPIRKLPATVELPRDATVEETKILIARQAGISDYNRVGLYDPTTKKTLKNRLGLVRDETNVMSAGELVVKDLGLQFAWRTVFVIEYAGPLLFHALFAYLRPYIYAPVYSKAAVEAPLTQVQWLLFAMFQLHFLKREYETVFVHRFSANTMPAWNIFRNSAFYWLMSGLLCALDIYRPGSLSERNELGPVDYLGLALFVGGEACNWIVHQHLASLRKPGGTEKGIPNCIGSSLVTCPNYMFEVTAWVGVILISRSVTVVAFICYGIYYMRLWSRGKEKALRNEFGDRYKKKRYTMLPGLI
ncbi:3-oxo-5-alpha-steroid 4-dehydrogenase-domain-containing protein [Lasiosphaeria miniovina]|uniref:3-oxo-5-alpha-steroid 4-dehydrogenase-domain-containing protein n=1 Tax=Lasiosphaeria miniovina TaxID=1954250 RepID=A0AA40DN48_9PEZI|nr:3-oxo-5-alpha-steroid 4-dehydrogenase-domain-containing protein [Lasiosphaeria miniovina]KAK0706957.1 3-oxo-5-alpha-steroid 4-dehydrogenase-domain-containing protein [Lasiosphaeria miniovina]